MLRYAWTWESSSGAAEASQMIWPPGPSIICVLARLPPLALLTTVTRSPATVVVTVCGAASSHVSTPSGVVVCGAPSSVSRARGAGRSTRGSDG